MLNQRRGKKLVALSIIFLVVLFSLSIALAQQQSAGGDQVGVQQIGDKAGNQSQGKNQSEGNIGAKVTGAIIFLIVTIGTFVFYMIYLQRTFLKTCQEEKQMVLFFQSPAGLPPGTVRSMIALIIITISLALLILSFFGITENKFPEMLAGLLGTVLGFYFGNRAASENRDEAAQQQIQSLETQRNQAETDKSSGQLGALVDNIGKGITLVKSAAVFLPEDMRKKFDDVTIKLEQGLGAVNDLQKMGNLKDAVSKAGELFNLFKSNNPAGDVFGKAVEAFGGALGASAPVIPIIIAVAGMCVKLTGTAYQKWKTRILHAPFSVAIVPLQVVDANTGFTLLVNSPIFKKAFTKELEKEDQPFLQMVAKLPSQMDVEVLWTAYKDRFESRAQFEDGLGEFLRAAADGELEPVIDSSALADAGGYRSFMQSIDRINADATAKPVLDELFVVAEGLHKSGQPVLSIFDKIKKGD